MQKPRVARMRLQCMPKRMAQIEDAAQSPFALVGGNHFRLNPHGFGNHVVHYVRHLSHHLSPAFRKQTEERRVNNHARFNDFIQSRAILPLRQCCQNRRINQHHQRLMKTPGEILAHSQIHTGLSADRCVYLRQQGRRNLNDRNPAHENRRQKSSHIRNNAAAKRNQKAGTVRAAFHHLNGQILNVRHPLVVFATRKKQRCKRHITQSQAQFIALQFPNVAGSHHKNPATTRGKKLLQPRDHTPLNERGISSLRRRNLILGHLPQLCHFNIFREACSYSFAARCRRCHRIRAARCPHNSQRVIRMVPRQVKLRPFFRNTAGAYGVRTASSGNTSKSSVEGPA